MHNDKETMEFVESYTPLWAGLSGKSFELSNGGVVLDKEGLKQNIPEAIECIEMMKKGLAHIPSKDGVTFPSALTYSTDIVHINGSYADFKEEQKGVKTKEQGYKNLDKWIDNMSKADNEKDFIKAVVMAYSYIQSYRKSEQDIFTENNILYRVSMNSKKSIVSMFKDEATHLKALDIISCSKDEACLANDINMPIKDLIAHKKIGETIAKLKKDDTTIKSYLESMINKSNESRDPKDFLILLGAVEYYGHTKGIENPLGYSISTKEMLPVVSRLTEDFINTHFLKKKSLFNHVQSNDVSQRT